MSDVRVYSERRRGYVKNIPEVLGSYFLRAMILEHEFNVKKIKAIRNIFLRVNE